jgi:hypothetical protein
LGDKSFSELQILLADVEFLVSTRRAQGAHKEQAGVCFWQFSKLWDHVQVLNYQALQIAVPRMKICYYR